VNNLTAGGGIIKMKQPHMFCVSEFLPEWRICYLVLTSWYQVSIRMVYWEIYCAAFKVWASRGL